MLRPLEFLHSATWELIQVGSLAGNLHGNRREPRRRSIEGPRDMGANILDCRFPSADRGQQVAHEAARERSQQQFAAHRPLVGAALRFRPVNQVPMSSNRGLARGRADLDQFGFNWFGMR